MKTSKRKDPFHVHGTISVPDEYPDCAICGKPVLWPQEEVAWDENNEICHAECVEEEESR